LASEKERYPPEAAGTIILFAYMLVVGWEEDEGEEAAGGNEVFK